MAERKYNFTFDPTPRKIREELAPLLSGEFYKALSVVAELIITQGSQHEDGTWRRRLGVRAVAAALGCEKSPAADLLQTLVRLGLLRCPGERTRDPRGVEYCLDPEFKDADWQTLRQQSSTRKAVNRARTETARRSRVHKPRQDATVLSDRTPAPPLLSCPSTGQYAPSLTGQYCPVSPDATVLSDRTNIRREIYRSTGLAEGVSALRPEPPTLESPQPSEYEEPVGQSREEADLADLFQNPPPEEPIPSRAPALAVGHASAGRQEQPTTHEEAAQHPAGALADRPAPSVEAHEEPGEPSAQDLLKLAAAEGWPALELTPGQWIGPPGGGRPGDAEPYWPLFITHATPDNIRIAVRRLEEYVEQVTTGE